MPRTVTTYDDLDDGQRRALAQRVGSLMGGRAGDIPRVLSRLDNSPEFAAQSLQRHADALGIEMPSGYRTQDERYEGMDYDQPLRQELQTQAARQEAQATGRPQSITPGGSRSNRTPYPPTRGGDESNMAGGASEVSRPLGSGAVDPRRGVATAANTQRESRDGVSDGSSVGGSVAAAGGVGVVAYLMRKFGMSPEQAQTVAAQAGLGNAPTPPLSDGPMPDVSPNTNLAAQGPPTPGQPQVQGPPQPPYGPPYKIPTQYPIGAGTRFQPKMPPSPDAGIGMEGLFTGIGTALRERTTGKPRTEEMLAEIERADEGESAERSRRKIKIPKPRVKIR